MSGSSGGRVARLFLFPTVITVSMFFIGAGDYWVLSLCPHFNVVQLKHPTVNTSHWYNEVHIVYVLLSRNSLPYSPINIEHVLID